MTTITPRQAAENAVFPWGDYLVDPARRLVCAAIPKSGCSDFKHWFVSVVEPEKLTNPSFRLHAHCRATHALSLIPPPRRSELLRDSFTIAFVRDPLSRVVSAYVEKFVRAGPHELFEPAREVLALHDSRPDEGISFRQFVEFLRRAPDEHLDPHWRPQAAFITGVRVDLLGRMEHQPAILAELGRILGAPDRADGRRNATGYTPGTGEFLADIPSATLHRKGQLPPASDLYDDVLRAAVLDRFGDDAMLHDAATDHAPADAARRLHAAGCIHEPR
jgi:hypothetical protein